ncbi:MAG: methyltransferase [Oscillospiraceae bacterium]
MKKINLSENEHIEYLSNEIGVVVSEKHTFGTDAILLADFARPKKNETACDFGTGCGIIPFLWCSNGEQNEISAVEIQKSGYNQLCRSIEMNEIQNIKPFNCDLKKIKGVLPLGQFNLVTMNPPYKKMNTGIKSSDECEKIARHETLCSINDICKSASSLLKFSGRFCICIKPERLFEAMKAMSDCKIEPKKLRLVVSKSNLAPWLCLIEGRRGGKSGMSVQNNLVLYKENGEYTDEMLKILATYREEMDNGR